jgi:cytidine deaminase
VDAARAAIRAHYRYGFHTVAAALRTRSGRIFTAVNLDATVGRMAVCAEPIALGQAIMAGERAFECVAAVRQPRPGEVPNEIAVVSPCGGCRELLCDHARDIAVIVPGARGPRRIALGDLLPLPYRR